MERNWTTQDNNQQHNQTNKYTTVHAWEVSTLLRLAAVFAPNVDQLRFLLPTESLALPIEYLLVHAGVEPPRLNVRLNARARACAGT